MSVKGVDILILANTGTDAVPVWTSVGGQRGASLEETNETIDVTSKTSNGAYEYEYGLSGWKISCDGVYVPDDTAYIALQTAMRTKAKIKVRISEEDTEVSEGTALVISRSIDGPYVGEATYSMELQGTGVLDTSLT